MQTAVLMAVLLALVPVDTPAAQVCTTQTVGNREFLGISGSSDTNIIGVGKKGIIYRYDGAAWNLMASPDDEDLNDVEVVDNSTAFAVGKKGETLQLVAGNWISHTGFTKDDLFGVWADSATAAWVVGEKGALFYFDGSTWTDQGTAAGTGKERLVDAWGDSNFFFALDTDGTLYRYDRNTGTWATPDASCDFGKGFEDLWGDGSGDIYLVKKKDIYQYDGASCTLVASASKDLRGVSGFGSQVVAAGKDGIVVQFDGVTWQEDTRSDEEIKDVWVSASGNAYFAGKNAQITSCVDDSVVFTINHDNYGIHCLAETMTVTIEDAQANPVNNYDEPVTLDTQTGNGTWVLISGGGTFTDPIPDDGLASYDWPLGESSAVFALSYASGTPILDIDVYQTSDPAVRDNDAEGNIEFSASGFTLTATALSNPPPGVIAPFGTTQIAGTDFNIFLAAYGQTANDPACGIIESYNGAQNLKFWFDRADPATGTIVPTIDGSAIGTVEGSASNQAVVFANGQAAVTAKYKDAGSIQVLVKDDSGNHPDLPTGIRGATANFVVKPAYFGLSGIEDALGNPNPAAADASGPVFVAAGAPFSVTVTAYDAEADVTPNFGRESAPETVLLTSSLAAPVGGNDPGISPALGFGSFSGGSATGTGFTWPEVGIITLQPSIGDGDYLGGGNVTGLASGNVGRFIPDHFTTALNAPAFDTQCAAGAFSYIGQPFGYDVSPLITVTARAANGGITQNYTSSFFKITNLSLLNRQYTSAVGTLDLTGLPPASSDPVVTDSGGGSSTLLFDSGTGIAFLRSAPEAAFDADISLSIEIFDTDGVTTPGSPVEFSSIDFDTGASMRYGRVRINNAIGSELVDLAVPMRSEYFVDAATGFIVNTDDSCTTNVTQTLSNFTDSLTAGDTCVLDNGNPGDSGAGCAAAGPAGKRYREPPLGGDFNLYLLAPGNGNQGSVDVNADVPAWLEFDWNTSIPGLEDPTGTATFGIYDGNSKRIYTREIY